MLINKLLELNEVLIHLFVAVSLRINAIVKVQLVIVIEALFNSSYTDV